jgi:hypothetical protein
MDHPHQFPFYGVEGMAISLKQQQPAQPVDEIAGTTQPKQPNDLVAVVLDLTGAQQQNEV